MTQNRVSIVLNFNNYNTIFNSKENNGGRGIGVAAIYRKGIVNQLSENELDDKDEAFIHKLQTRSTIFALGTIYLPPNKLPSENFFIRLRQTTQTIIIGGGYYFYNVIHKLASL